MSVQKIKAAYILTPITFGGAEKVSLNFLRTVDRDLFDIRPILLTRPWEEEPYFAREIQRLGYDYVKVPVALRPLSNGRDRMRLPRVAYRFRSILKRESFDVVHTHGYFADICGLPVARLQGLRTISTCHGFVSNDRKMGVYNKVDTYALRLCRSIIAVSECIKSELVQRGIKESKIAVIPNAVSSPIDDYEFLALRHKKRSSLEIDAKDFVVGYLGRLSKEKGLSYLIQALAELAATGEPIKLLIVGEGPEKEALEQIVQEKNLGSQVIFAGFQTDIENWLPVLDVFALPSLTEGTPMALLEAMAMEIPVLATAAGGVPKVVTDGVNGLLVPPGNHQNISNGLKMLKNNPELRVRLAREGSDMIKRKYSISKWCREIEQIYCGNNIPVS